MSATTLPELIILRLGDDKSVFDEKFGNRVSIIKETFVTKELFGDVLHPVNEPRLKAVIVVPTQIGSLNQAEIRARLSRFVRAGGTVIVAFLFLTASNDWELDSVFWDLKRQWRVDNSAHRHARLKLSLNESIKDKMGYASCNLQKAYDMEAVKIIGVAQNEMVYVDTKSYLSGNPAEDCYVGCPSAFARVGSGYLGYVGDLRVDSGTVALVMAMLTRAIGTPHLKTPTTSSAEQRINFSPTPPGVQAWTNFSLAPSQPSKSALPSVSPSASQTTVADPTPSATIERKDVDTSMPPLAACNPGCAVCTILLPAMKCTGCRKAQYCSVECQTKDWPVHKLACGNAKAVSRDGVDGSSGVLGDWMGGEKSVFRSVIS